MPTAAVIDSQSVKAAETVGKDSRGFDTGKLVTWAKCKLRLPLVVKRPDDLHEFKVLPRRWVVERTLAWITRSRRNVRDYERLPAHHETMVHWSMIIIMSRHLAKHNQSHQPRAA